MYEKPSAVFPNLSKILFWKKWRKSLWSRGSSCNIGRLKAQKGTFLCWVKNCEMLCCWERQNSLFVFEETSKVIIMLYKYVLIFIKKVWILDILMFQSESVFVFNNCIFPSDTTLVQIKFIQYFCYRIQCLDHSLLACQLQQQHPFSMNNWSKNCRVLWLYFLC